MNMESGLAVDLKKWEGKPGGAKFVMIYMISDVDGYQGGQWCTELKESITKWMRFYTTAAS